MVRNRQSLPDTAECMCRGSVDCSLADITSTRSSCTCCNPAADHVADLTHDVIAQIQISEDPRQTLLTTNPNRIFYEA
jgi:hypothetical protein